MGPGDLVRTPPWTWHDHGHGSDEPVVWMDGLDLPFVRDMDANFFEPIAGEQQSLTKPTNDLEQRYGVGQLRPTWEHPAGPSSPLLNTSANAPRKRYGSWPPLVRALSIMSHWSISIRIPAGRCCRP